MEQERAAVGQIERTERARGFRPRQQKALQVAQKLNTVAARLGEPPAAVAIAYALVNPLVATALFGATSPEQVHQNCRALDAKQKLSPAVLNELRAPS